MLFLLLLIIGAVNWVKDKLVMPAPPSLLSDGVYTLQEVFQQANQFCMWVDIPYAVGLVGVSLVFWVVGLGIRMTRIVFGFFIG